MSSDVKYTLEDFLVIQNHFVVSVYPSHLEVVFKTIDRR